MLEKVFTTKMSADKKKLQNRFAKIRSKNGRLSKLFAGILFGVIIVAIISVGVFMALNDTKDYEMTDEEFSNYIHRPIGSIMAEIDYIDNEKLVFHYLKGLFVLNLESNELEQKIDLSKLNVAGHTQGSCHTVFNFDKQGEFAYLTNKSTPEDEAEKYDDYIINLKTGEAKIGTMPDGTELFVNYAETFSTVSETIGWISDRCIILGDKIHYLTTQDSIIAAIQLVTVNKNQQNDVSMQYVFGTDYVSLAQHKANVINETLKEGEEILINSGLAWEVNADSVKAIIDKLSETRQMKHFDIQDGNYDIRTYQIWKNDSSEPRLYIIDNYKLKLVFSTALSKEEYFDINKLMYNSNEGIYDSYKTYADTPEKAIEHFFEAFSNSNLEKMKTLGTNEFIKSGYIGDYKMCYGMTRATLETCSKANVKEFLKHYFEQPIHAQITLSGEDIELLKEESDKLSVYTVTVTAESNIKSEVKPPFKRFLNVICKKEAGGYLVHKLY